MAKSKNKWGNALKYMNQEQDTVSRLRGSQQQPQPKESGFVGPERPIGVRLATPFSSYNIMPPMMNMYPDNARQYAMSHPYLPVPPVSRDRGDPNSDLPPRNDPYWDLPAHQGSGKAHHRTIRAMAANESIKKEQAGQRYIDQVRSSPHSPIYYDPPKPVVSGGPSGYLATPAPYSRHGDTIQSVNPSSGYSGSPYGSPYGGTTPGSVPVALPPKKKPQPPDLGRGGLQR